MYLFARLFFALDLQERERAHGLARAARMERAKRLADRAVLEGAAHGDERVARVIAKRGREGDLFFRRRACCTEVRRAEVLAQLLCQRVDQRVAILFRRGHNLHQRRPAERGYA